MNEQTGSWFPTPPTARRCALCGKGGSMAAYTTVCRWHGLKGNYLHLRCVLRLRKKTPK